MTDREDRFHELIQTIIRAEDEIRSIVEVHKYEQRYSWMDPASTPIEDVRYAIKMFEQVHGAKPSFISLPTEAFDALCDHPDLIDRVKYGVKGNFSRWNSRPSPERMGEAMSQYFGIPIRVNDVKSFDVGEVECGFVKTIWFSKEQDVHLLYWDSAECDAYYEALKSEQAT